MIQQEEKPGGIRTRSNSRAILGILICAVMIATVLSVKIPIAVSAQQVTEEWVATYGDYGYNYMWFRAIALDSVGNVYVSGYGYASGGTKGYITIAYDSSGNELWVANYNGTGRGGGEAWAIATDESGNIYVTGWSCCTGDTVNMGTVAYDSFGNELWAARSNGTGKGYAVMTDSGNIYVTGVGDWEDDTLGDYVTIAYDSYGNELWVAEYNGPGNGLDEAYDIAGDSYGNIYVTGRSVGLESGFDYATVAYDSSGNELWVARFGSSGPAYDQAFALDVDTSGNVYVTGRLSGLYSAPGYGTVAYDSSGNELWVAIYNHPGAVYDIAVAPSGNVHVTGQAHTNPKTSHDYTTITYDSSGAELWVATYDGPDNGLDIAYAIAVDSSGNLYVTGQSASNQGHSDFATVAYDSSGNELWTARYDSPAGNSDLALAVVVDNSRNVYVSGYGYGTGTESFITTIKYSQEWVPEARLDIHPDTLNLRSKGRWITAYIELLGGDVVDIDMSTLLLNDAIPAERWPTAIGDYDEDGIPDLMVKFNRSKVQEYMEGLNLSPGGAGIFGYYVTLNVTGSFNDGTTFECSDTIRVLVVERMGVELSPFSIAEYDGSMKGGIVAAQPQISFPLSSHSSEHLVMVVSDVEYRESPTRRMNYVLIMRE